MISLIQKLRKILPPSFKWGLILFTCLMILGALLELAALGAVMSLVSAFSSPGFVHSNKVMEFLYHFTRAANEKQFVVYMAVFLSLLYLLKNVYGWSLLYLQSLFAVKLSLHISDRLYRNYLNAPYAWHVQTGASTLITRVNQVCNFTNQLLRPCMLIATECFVVLAIASTLFYIAPVIALSTVAVVIVLLFAFYLPMRKILTNFGKTSLSAASKVMLFLNQGLNAVREVKLTNSSRFFQNQLSKVQKKRYFAEKRIGDFSEIPRFAMEAFCVSLAMGILISLIALNISFEKILIYAALFIAAMFRLLPSFSRIQYNLYIIRGAIFLFDVIYRDLTTLPEEKVPENASAIPFKNEISVEHLFFSYSPDRPDLFHDFSMRIACRESVAFVGKTGCGKTTLADIIMGFYSPDKGKISVDGVNIADNLPAWRSRIGYVPQNMVLFDDTVRGNIAFGVPPDRIDDAQLQNAIRMAQAEEFIRTLPDGMDTVIGESGIRLSGGQRQRIAIARALYHNPELLILDEATSALDNDTEKALIDALVALKGRLTIIMIAHRLSSIEHCDRVIPLDPAEKEK